MLSVSNTTLKDNDSGLGGSSSDVLVFGTEAPVLAEISKSKLAAPGARVSWACLGRVLGVELADAAVHIYPVCVGL